MLYITMARQDKFANGSDVTSFILRPVHDKIIITDGDSAKERLAKFSNSAQHEVDKTKSLVNFGREGR